MNHVHEIGSLCSVCINVLGLVAIGLFAVYKAKKEIKC